jgi:iron(III) transport system substrate-binding protein
MTSFSLPRRALAGAALALLGTGAAIAQTTSPTDAGADFDAVLAGAKREGKLTAWIASPRNPATHRALIDAFNQRFGLATELEWVPNSAVTSNSRTIAEAAGGKVSVDVIGGGAIEEVAAAVAGKIIRPYPWSAVFGKALPRTAAIEKLIMANYAGTAVPYQVVVYGLAWNPNQIAEHDLPARLVDLGDPKYHGMFSFNAFFLVPLDVASYTLGVQPTLELAKRIIANRPVLEKGTPAVARSVVTGATAFGVTVAPIAELSERMHEPLKFRLFADVIPESKVFLYVPEGAPHPNTARLFTAWLATEGAAVADPLEPFPAVGDPDARINRMIADQERQTGARVSEPKTPADLAASAKLRDAFSQLIAGD